jgi:hypothetical protein
MLTEDELWSGVEKLFSESTVVESLKRKSHHTIIATNPATKEYTIKYGKSGDPVVVKFWKVCKMYSMLCDAGRLFNSDMKNGGHNEVDMSTWHIPGSAMLAVIPLLDSEVTINEDGPEAGLYRKLPSNIGDDDGDDDYYDDDYYDDSSSGRTSNDDRSDSMNPNSDRYNPGR